MAVVALASLLGVVAGLWICPPVDIVWLIVAAPCLLALLWWLGGRWLLLVFGCYLWAAVQADVWRSGWVGDVYYHRDVLLSGCVANFPRGDERSTAFLFRTVPSSDSFNRSQLVFLRIYEPDKGVEPGSCHSFLVRLKPPHGLSNAGSFDRQVWLMRQRVAAVGYVRASLLNRERPDLSLQKSALYWRASIDRRIRKSIADPLMGGLVAGLSVGSRAGISPRHWEVFRVTGTLHLMAISGLHVALVGGGLWWMITWLGRACGAYPRLWFTLLASLGSVMCALSYAILAGWSVSASRAALMFAVFILFTWLRRPVAALEIMFIVLLVTVIVDPFVVLFGGFWMSFFAVWLLLTHRLPAAAETDNGANRLSIKRAARQLLGAQWRLSSGLLLPNLLLFDGFALLAPLVNLLAIPLFSLIILPATLFSVVVSLVWPAAAVTALALPAAALGLGLQGLQWVAQLPLASGGWLDGLAGVEAMLALAGLIFLLPPPLRSPRMWACPLAAVGLFVGSDTPEGFRVEVLDVGQGTAVLVRTRQHAMLVDTGPAWPGGDAGLMTVLPFLEAQKLNRLDLILISHADGDHSGGLSSLRDRFPRTPVLMPKEHRQANAWRCRRGMRWQWDEVEFRVLHPRTPAGWSDNNASCVLAVNYRGAQALFPGDIEAEAESVLLARDFRLQSDLVIVPHHGSRTSSGGPMIHRVSPGYAVHTTSFWNRWSFPAPEVVERWDDAGGCQLNTALTGGLRFDWQERRGLMLTQVHSAHWTRPWAVRPVSDNYCLEA